MNLTKQANQFILPRRDMAGGVTALTVMLIEVTL